MMMLLRYYHYVHKMPRHWYVVYYGDIIELMVSAAITR